MDLPFPPQELAPLYRFALMLTGDQAAAEQMVVEACAHCAPQLESYRTPASRTACLLFTVRALCLKRQQPTGHATSDPTLNDNVVLARKIAGMPEPERSALALFYLHILPAREIAAVLKLSLEDLASALAKGRDRLRREAGDLAARQTIDATP